MSPGTCGAASELVACAYLMRAGYEVFRAVSPSTSCDLIACRDGVTKRVEVRSGRYYRRGTDRCDLYLIVRGDSVTERYVPT